MPIIIWDKRHYVMKSNTLFSLPILGCIAFASCTPIVDDSRKPTGPNPNPDETITSAEQQKIDEQRKAMEERAKQKEQETADRLKETQENTVAKPPEKETSDYAFANPVPGKEGFVFSPYNNKLVDVRDIPSGTLVQDPTYPASEKKYFRVP
ncbi:MAG: hypothetical protein AB8D78_05970 [Akkermansiaceae bacterium]